MGRSGPMRTNKRHKVRVIGPSRVEGEKTMRFFTFAKGKQKRAMIRLNSWQMGDL